MTYKIQSATGHGTAKEKRSHHGCEKNWNRYGEPFVHLLHGRMKFHTTEEWLSRKPVPTLELNYDT